MIRFVGISSCLDVKLLLLAILIWENGENKKVLKLVVLKGERRRKCSCRDVRGASRP